MPTVQQAAQLFSLFLNMALNLAAILSTLDRKEKISGRVFKCKVSEKNIHGM